MSARRAIAAYFETHYLAYLGVIVCNLFSFSFHWVFDWARKDTGTLAHIAMITYVAISFIFPITLVILFAIKCFIRQSPLVLLGNIIHAYLSVILVFASLYFQCSVIGDLADAINKRDRYTSQLLLQKEGCASVKLIRVADKRAFKGIKARIWSGLDYPDAELIKRLKLFDSCTYIPAPGTWMNSPMDNYEELSVDQIVNIADRLPDHAGLIRYQGHNVLRVYFDCIYYSVICVATVGFGDITPTTIATKLITCIEVLVGMVIFVFAAGLFISNWRMAEKGAAAQ